MVMYDNEFKLKENKIQTKEKIEPQQIYKWGSHKQIIWFDIQAKTVNH